MRSHRNRQGFTLIELMVTAGLLGVLAAIAIPNFITYQARSKRSESFTNLSALARAQKAYQAERNGYLDTLVSWPDDAMYGGLGTKQMPWDSDAQAAFGELGWAPEGQVYYSYAAYTNATATTGNNCSACPLCFTAAAYGDVDGNGSTQVIMFVHPEDVGGAQAWCNEELLLNPPPIDPASGNIILDAVAARSNTDF
jgi:type IV pilus assembly protein PilA